MAQRLPMFGFVTPPKKTSRYLPGSPLAMADSADDGNIPEKETKEDEEQNPPTEVAGEEVEPALKKKPAGKTNAKAKALATPKAKAAAKAKAKATPKAKALAKGKAKASPKKEKDSRKSDPKVLKRTACSKAKAESMADKLEKWREGLKKAKIEIPGDEAALLNLNAEEGQEQGEEEDPKEEDECVEP